MANSNHGEKQEENKEEEQKKAGEGQMTPESQAKNQVIINVKQEANPDKALEDLSKQKSPDTKEKQRETTE